MFFLLVFLGTENRERQRASGISRSFRESCMSFEEAEGKNFGEMVN